MSKPFAIIQMGEPPVAIIEEVGQQNNWFTDALSLTQSHYKVYRPDQNDSLPPPSSLSGAVITGSWAMVTDLLPWSEETAQWIREAHKLGLPLLGVCYGHQLITHALGGKVGFNPAGSERGLQTVKLCGNYQHEPLLEQLPRQISAWLSHQQTVLEPPAGAEVMGYSEQDACQIIKYSDTTFSVQFHPEFSFEIMQACLNHNGANSLLADSHSHPTWPKIILQRFYQSSCAGSEQHRRQ